MLPPFLGQLLTVATGLGLGLATIVALWAGIRGSWVFVRLALGTSALVLGTYGSFFGLGLLLARDRVLPPGEAVRFCGLDCHLHVQVEAVGPGAVVVRFSSNAVRVPERPAELAFTLIDAEGGRHRPRNRVPDRGLGPGESWTHELRFDPGVALAGAALAVTWKPGLHYLVPGAGNPLVQRRTRLGLPPLRVGATTR